ncbi:MAG: hypothetical protein MUF80_11785 [Burkholderiales bacterium]|jgi:hypothetical protein|nr:hypothetical protein [Burkholderiales bacterium]
MSEQPPRDEWQAYRDVISSFGSPEKLRAKLDELDRLIEERNRRIWLAAAIKTTALYVVPVFAALQLFKDQILAWLGIER